MTKSAPPPAQPFLELLGESGWAILLDAALAFDAAGGDALRAAERLRKAKPEVRPDLRAAALELTAEGARLARKLGIEGERLLAVRGAVEQASSGRVATWHAQRLPGGPGEARVVEIGCGAGGDSIALAHRARNLIACDIDPVRAACAHHNLAAFGLSSARAVPADGFEVLAGEGSGADVVFCDPDRRVGGERSLDPEEWGPPLSRLADLAATGMRVLVKAAPSLDADLATGAFRVSYVSHRGECVEAFLESRVGIDGATGDDPSAPDVCAVLLPEDGPSVTLSGDRSDAPDGDLGESVYTADPAAIRARLLAELAARHRLTLVTSGIALMSGPAGVVSPWLAEHRVSGSCGLQDVPAALRRMGAGSLRIHVRGVPATAADLEKAWRGALTRGGPAIDVFATRLRDRPAAVLATRSRVADASVKASHP